MLNDLYVYSLVVTTMATSYKQVCGVQRIREDVAHPYPRPHHARSNTRATLVIHLLDTPHFVLIRPTFFATHDLNGTYSACLRHG